MPQQHLHAWLVPWRVGADKTMVITVRPETSLIMDVSCWLELETNHKRGETNSTRQRIVRRAAKILEMVPSAFAAQPTVAAAYDALEEIWNDSSLENEDPQGELLKSHATRLRVVLEDLCRRPRTVLRTEHRLLKLQAVRRTNAKTLKWLSAQPGRNIAERAGARQRIKAPKRYDTIVTLENQVLNAFVSLTIRQTKSWLTNAATNPIKSIVEAHQARARRIESVLKRYNVPEARPPVIPNFALRFDRRYNAIWCAWLELLSYKSTNELQWMWQHQTLMELLNLRAAMKLHERVRHGQCGGTLSHAPSLKASHAPNQGRYLQDTGIRATFGYVVEGAARSIEFGPHDKDTLPLGAVAAAGPEGMIRPEGVIWWNAYSSDKVPVSLLGELPWHDGCSWDCTLAEWASKVSA